MLLVITPYEWLSYCSGYGTGVKCSSTTDIPPHADHMNGAVYAPYFTLETGMQQSNDT